LGRKEAVVLVIETEKVQYEVESLNADFLHILVAADAKQPVDAVVGQLAETEEEIKSLQAASGVVAAPEASERSKHAPAKSAAPVAVAGKGQRVRISPVAKKMAGASGIDINSVTGTGPGRLVYGVFDSINGKSGAHALRRNPMKVKDKIAIVTGGGGGLGEGIALCLAKEGAHVVVSDNQLNLAEKVAAKVRDLGRKSISTETDVTDEAQVQQMVDETVKELGGLDIMICCAGISGIVDRGIDSEEALRIENIQVEDWDTTFAVNVKGVFLCNRAAAPIFRKQNSGKIVNISSVAGRRPNDFLLAYATSKAAVISFTQSMALLMAPHHINVNCVCPGIIYTPMWKAGSELLVKIHPALKGTGLGPKEALDAMVNTLIPFKKYQTPEDIGNAVTFLCSSEAEEITGQSLNVCGGMAFN